MSSFPAMHYESLTNGLVRCLLCPQYCEIQQAYAGKCGVRKNYSGKLIADSFAKINGIQLDPIEKKPLRFFHPGSMILSVGTYGCNLDCPFCQNYKSVRQHFERKERTFAGASHSNQYDMITPKELAKLAQKYVSYGNIGVAYTYNEPIVGYEYVYESAKLIKEANLKNILVTNGFINPEPLNKLLPYVDAMNIDLKGFSQEFYDKLGGKLEAVKEAITIALRNCHVEITFLVIPDENECDIENAAKWLSSQNPDIPLHLSRFFPRYKYSNYSPTPLETLSEAARIAKKYLKNVVIGNVH